MHSPALTVGGGEVDGHREVDLGPGEGENAFRDFFFWGGDDTQDVPRGFGGGRHLGCIHTPPYTPPIQSTPKSHCAEVLSPTSCTQGCGWGCWGHPGDTASSGPRIQVGKLRLVCPPPPSCVPPLVCPPPPPHHSPAPDVVQESVVGLHREGEQCHLPGDTGLSGGQWLCRPPQCHPRPVLTVPEFKYFFFFIFFLGFTTWGGRRELRSRGAAAPPGCGEGGGGQLGDRDTPGGSGGDSTAGGSAGGGRSWGAQDGDPGDGDRDTHGGSMGL